MGPRDEHTQHGHGEETNVVYLPTDRDDTPTVVDAEVVEDGGGERVPARTDQARQAYNTRLIPTAARERMATGAVVAVRRATPVAVAGFKGAARHAVYLANGAREVRARWRDEHSAGRYERQMRAAEMEGNHERLLEWEARDTAEKQRRHDRKMDWLDAPGKLIKAGATGLAGLAGFLLVLGFFTFFVSGQTDDIVGPITGVIEAVAWVVWLVSAGWMVLAGLAVATVVAYLHHQGRRSGDTPAWLGAAPGEHVRPDSDVDESMIMSALRNLGHSALNRKFKEGWGSTVQPTWVQPPLPVGNGWEFVLRLPGGVPATTINDRKVVLAHNLGRRPEEVFIDIDSTDPQAMKCLVLDPGSLRDPVPDYPLVESGQTDFFTGFPVGIDARRNEVVTPVFERNFVKAGTMGSGKSTGLQTELAGAVLDPVVDIDIFCFAENNDYEWLRPIASTLSTGDTAENVEACIAHLESLHESLAERGRLFREHNIDSLTRTAAEADERLRPRIVVIDECQSFFRQDKPEDRKRLVNMVVRFYSAARKYGIVLSFATPNPSDDSLPRDLMAVTSNKSCYAIGDKTRNNIVLGDKAHENGLSALGLKPMKKQGEKIISLNDVGTSISVGYSDEPGVLRSYNLTKDQKATIVARGLELRGGQVTRTKRAEPEDRDLLDDVAAVIAPDEDRVKATDVCARLRKLAPNYRPYVGSKATGKTPLNGDELKEQLDALGCKVTKSSVLWVYADRVRHARTSREGGSG